MEKTIMACFLLSLPVAFFGWYLFAKYVTPVLQRRSTFKAIRRAVRAYPQNLEFAREFGEWSVNFRQVANQRSRRSA